MAASEKTPTAVRLHIPTEVCVQIAFPDTVSVDVNIHIGFSILFVDLLKAAEKVSPVVLLESIGTQELQNPLVPFGIRSKAAWKGSWTVIFAY